MKRILAYILLIATAATADNVSNPTQGVGASRVLHVIDTDIDSALEIVDADSGFTPLKANGVINVLYEAANTDTAYINITGLRADSTWVDTTMLVPGRQPASTAATFMAFDQAHLQHETNGIVAVYSTATSSSSMLRTIAANVIHEPIAQIYAGKRGVFLRSVRFTHLNASDTTNWEMRIYPDIADHRDFADGYEIRASARLNKTNSTSGDIPLEVYLPNNSWAAVFSNAASSSVAGVKGAATLKYDRR